MHSARIGSNIGGMHRLFGGVTTLLVTLAVATHVPLTWAASHREAPLIALDPAADNTDVYAFRSWEDPSKVVFILITGCKF